jgi:hypothetical protein
MFIENILLSNHPERRSDEGRLPSRITCGQPFDLTLPDHVDCSNAFGRPFSRMKCLEALRGSRLLLSDAT